MCFWEQSLLSPLTALLPKAIRKECCDLEWPMKSSGHFASWLSIQFLWWPLFCLRLTWYHSVTSCSMSLEHYDQLVYTNHMLLPYWLALLFSSNHGFRHCLMCELCEVPSLLASTPLICSSSHCFTLTFCSFLKPTSPWKGICVFFIIQSTTQITLQKPLEEVPQ
jgi:hypothetical protein